MKKITQLVRHLFSFNRSVDINKQEFFEEHSMLLVEDNQVVMCAIKNLLEQQSYLVTTVRDGSKALHFLKTYNYDLALIDLVLPEIDGIDLVKNYRDWEKEQHKPYMPVFGLTGYPFKSMKHVCREAGIDFLFEKPFKVNDVQIMRNFLKDRKITT